MFKRTGAWLFGLSIVTAGFMASVLAAPPLPGAIFTTDVNGTQVNGNVYENCTDVYLNGGPPPNAPCSAAGLPDGCYCYQVTDPSGKVLLSLDDISNRGFQVEGGLIVHDNGNHGHGLGKCHETNPNNISIQLMPFAPTPNPGGEYKVWVVPCEDFSPGQGSFGFIPSKTKTDNFKCVQCPAD